MAALFKLARIGGADCVFEMRGRVIFGGLHDFRAQPTALKQAFEHLFEIVFCCVVGKGYGE